MKYIKCFKNITEVGNGVEIDTPNVIYLKDKNLLYVPKSNSKVTIINDGNDNIKIAGTDESSTDDPEVIEFKVTYPANGELTININESYTIQTNITDENVIYTTDDHNYIELNDNTVIGIAEGNAKVLVKHLDTTIEINVYVVDRSATPDNTTTSTTTKIPETSGQTQTDNEDENQSSGDTGQTDPATEPPTPTTSENPNGNNDEGDSGNTESGETPDVIDLENPEHME